MSSVENSSSRLEKKEQLSSHVLGWIVDAVDDANVPRVKIDRNSKRIIVNRALIPDFDEARRVGFFVAAQEAALEESLRGSETKEALRLFSEEPVFTRELLRLTGISILADIA